MRNRQKKAIVNRLTKPATNIHSCWSLARTGANSSAKRAAESSPYIVRSANDFLYQGVGATINSSLGRHATVTSSPRNEGSSSDAWEGRCVPVHLAFRLLSILWFWKSHPPEHDSVSCYQVERLWTSGQQKADCPSALGRHHIHEYICTLASSSDMTRDSPTDIALSRSRNEFNWEELYHNYNQKWMLLSVQCYTRLPYRCSGLKIASEALSGIGSRVLDNIGWEIQIPVRNGCSGVYEGVEVLCVWSSRAQARYLWSKEEGEYLGRKHQFFARGLRERNEIELRSRYQSRFKMLQLGLRYPPTIPDPKYKYRIYNILGTRHLHQKLKCLRFENTSPRAEPGSKSAFLPNSLSFSQLTLYMVYKSPMVY